MKTASVKVYAPATIANVGPGFDILGLAIDAPGDIITATRTEEKGVSFRIKHDITGLPNGKKNVAAHVASCILDVFNPPFGISLILDKKMPLGSGLGSSGASCAAAACAVNALLPSPLPRHELVAFAAEGERLATGSAHADNVAPSLLGGICLIRSYDPLEVIELPYNNCFYWVVVHPQLVIKTRDARRALPKTIPLTTALKQSGNLATLITGLESGNAHLVANALIDEIAEPVRSSLIPGYDVIKQSALESGAIGFSISGSGPSVFAIAATLDDASRIAKVIESGFARHADVACDIYCSRINPKGAIILEQSP